LFVIRFAGFLHFGVATLCRYAQPVNRWVRCKRVLIPLSLGHGGDEVKEARKTAFSWEKQRKRKFDRSVTGQLNVTLMFVCNKTSIPGWVGKELRPSAEIGRPYH
jgi:hypothetical protein